ncbi:reticulocalbin-3 [Puma concolor]|uniref:Reticulocalbin-3 n=1 Tax=Puma concolor TaxID=9696 RepID=A0A6P6H430_PUMCO|nr:reticulocalbin-3 [Puma concolor]
MAHSFPTPVLLRWPSETSGHSSGSSARPPPSSLASRFSIWSTSAIALRVPLVSQPETLEDLDKNKDGYVQVEEYIGELNLIPSLRTLVFSRTARRIVDRMDRAGDGDGWVSLAELRAWIAHTQQRHIRDSVSAAWNTYDTDRDGRVGWEELRNATYGHYEPGEEFHDVEDAETYKKMMARDERRFRVADQDGDSMATREELTAFLHPEEFPHMRDIVIAVNPGF